jgi:hypothetical protein
LKVIKEEDGDNKLEASTVKVKVRWMAELDLQMLSKTRLMLAPFKGYGILRCARCFSWRNWCQN